MGLSSGSTAKSTDDGRAAGYHLLAAQVRDEIDPQSWCICGVEPSQKHDKQTLFIGGTEKK